jgi:hypothetical protein
LGKTGFLLKLGLRAELGLFHEEIEKNLKNHEKLLECLKACYILKKGEIEIDFDAIL